jgi:leukotriene-A4 hydrolase
VRLARDDVAEVCLDTNMLTVSAVTVNGDPVVHVMGTPHSALGTRLTAPVPEAHRGRGRTVEVAVSYTTDPEAPGIGWLTPEQTTGGEHPYMFTQFEPILARTCIPMQDSPAAMATFSARLVAPRALTALMSAHADGEPEDVGTDARAYKFMQPVPVPPHIIAIVAGHLEKRDISPRCAVWSEPGIVDKCAHEFAETEKMIETAESLLGPYVWGRFDLLVAPSSFPYGGMEGQLCLVTPTLLTKDGDRSLTGVIAHEIAHSWSGNLVSCHDFGHFWINEGVNVYCERRILAALSDTPAQTFDFEAGIGWCALEDSVNGFGATHNYTCLIPHIVGADPDDAFSSIPYEKGFTFMCYLEQLVGGETAFMPFLRAYFANFSHRSVDTNHFRAFFEGFFAASGTDAAREAIRAIDWEAWFMVPGMPPWTPKRDTTLAERANALAALWTDKAGEGAKASDLDGFSARQTIMFMENLLAKVPFSTERLDAIGTTYGFDDAGNCEILFRWISLRLLSHDARAFPAAAAFLKAYGRMKYVRPLMKNLAACPDGGRDQALAVNEYMAKRWHPICAKMVKKDLEAAK